MPIDRSGAREEALYAGLAEDAPHSPPPRPQERASRRRSPRRDMVVGGVILTLGLGILAGAVALPELSDELGAGRASPPTPRPVLRTAPAPLPPAPHQPAPLQSVTPASIAVSPVLPEAAPAQAPPKAPEAAAPAARGPQQTALVTPPRVKPLPETGGQLTLPPEMATSTAAATPAAAPAPAPAPAPAKPVGGAHATASFDCAAAEPGGAEQMVCSDPELAAADRRMGQAYNRARRSGAVDPEDLDLDQRDWAALREDAARYSRRALASVYAQRIDELNEIADDGPRDRD